MDFIKEAKKMVLEGLSGQNQSVVDAITAVDSHIKSYVSIRPEKVSVDFDFSTIDDYSFGKVATILYTVAENKDRPVVIEFQKPKELKLLKKYGFVENKGRNMNYEISTPFGKTAYWGKGMKKF